LSVPVLRLEGLEWKEMEWMMRCELYLSVEGLFDKREAIWNRVLTLRRCVDQRNLVHESAICK